MESTLNNSSSGSESEVRPPVIYRCKKCRNIVATEDLIVSHKRGEGQKCFKWKKRDGSSGSDVEVPECSSIFVEPMKWMQQAGSQILNSIYVPSSIPNFQFMLCFVIVEEGCVEDKLQCFSCKARLGSFNWAGMQCNCGTWINPAFQLHKSRMDESRF